MSDSTMHTYGAGPRSTAATTASARADSDVPMLPDYGGENLCHVLTSAAASVGLSGYENTLGLPTAKRICVLLIDGLGAGAALGHAADAPTLVGLMAGDRAASDGAVNDGAGIGLVRGGHGDLSVVSRQLTAGFPSTTGASLASIGTGLPPSRHGLVGYRVLIPERGTLMSLLQWDGAVDPAVWQPYPTIFEQLAQAGVSTVHVASPDFANSGLTRSAFRGARYAGAWTPGELIAATATALNDDTPIVFSYYPDLDKTGHGNGVDSPAWRHQLAVVDLMVRRLIAELPTDTTLVITGDHGMVDIEPHEKLDLDSAPELTSG
ncbi:MAG: alkaline phosphatase family protein, partial [Mycobacteriales bacterium]